MSQNPYNYCMYFIIIGVLAPNFAIYGLCQVRAMFPDAPGAMLYKEIQTWKGTGKNNTWSWVGIHIVLVICVFYFNDLVDF